METSFFAWISGDGIIVVGMGVISVTVQASRQDVIY